MFDELLSRDHEDGFATGQPQGVGPEAYLNGTSQGPTPEDARMEVHIRGRSKRFIKHPGSGILKKPGISSGLYRALFFPLRFFHQGVTEAKQRFLCPLSRRLCRPLHSNFRALACCLLPAENSVLRYFAASTG
jgi:hypothetical protein